MTVVLFIYASCSKNTEEMDSASSPSYSAQIINDEIGISHNKMLEYVSTRIGFLNFTQEEIVEHLLIYSTNHFAPDLSVNENIAHYSNFLNENRAICYGSNAIQNIAIEFYNTGEISSPIVYDYLITLNNLIEELESSQLDHFNSQMDNIRAQINLDQNLSSSEIELLSGAYSVAKYSLSYWNSELNNLDNSNWRSVFVSSGDPIEDVPTAFYKIRRGAADAAGWVVGFVQGGIVGAKVGSGVMSSDVNP